MNHFFLRLCGALAAVGLARAGAAQLLESGSFEAPRVKSRTPLAMGGNPLLGGNGEWLIFNHPREDEKNGSVVAGITNEIARTGKQSLFIEFTKFKAVNSGVTLASELISIQPSKPYHIAIWGRVDRKKPLTLDQRVPYLRLLAEFYMADKETQTGEAIFRVQPMPDSPNKPTTRPALFTSKNWSEYFVNTTTPEDAAFLKLTWKWEAAKDEGETSGVIYFDDATIEGEPGPVPPEEPEPVPEPAAPGEEMKELERLEKLSPAKPNGPANPDATAAPKSVPGAELRPKK